jgi:uridylate kinase
MKNVILSLGGSLIVPKEVNTEYLYWFTHFIKKMTDDYRFVIFCGGGKIAREYQSAAQAISTTMSNDAKDWIGIRCSQVNAELVKHAFGRLAHVDVITDPQIKLNWSKKIYVGAGWKPGHSTDFDAVLLAAGNGIDTVINLSNVEYVYTKDPNKFPDAEKIEQMSWKDFRVLVGDVWNPGLNTPFDPIAAKLAQRHKMTVRIVNGNLPEEELKKAITGKPFKGTEIR